MAELLIRVRSCPPAVTSGAGDDYWGKSQRRKRPVDLSPLRFGQFVCCVGRDHLPLEDHAPHTIFQATETSIFVALFMPVLYRQSD